MQEQSRGRRSSTSGGGGSRWFFSLQRKGKKNKLLSGSGSFGGSRSEWDLRKPPVNKTYFFKFYFKIHFRYFIIIDLLKSFRSFNK